MTIADRFTEIRERMAALRPQVRPEGDQAYSSLGVAVDQAEAEAEAGGEAPAPTPVDVQLAELVAGQETTLETLAGVVGTLTAIQSAVGAGGTPAP